MSGLVRCIDMESTALVGGEVIEVGWYDFDPASGRIVGGFSELCRVSAIPPETRAVHHIRLNDVQRTPPYDRHLVYERAVQEGVVAFAAHNTGLEEQFLPNGLPIVCTYKAALRHWPDAPGTHSLFQLLYWLEDERKAEYWRHMAYPQHRAQPDAYACAVLLQTMMAEGVTGKDLFDWTFAPRLLPRIPIGKWRGRRWSECDDGFLEWIMRTIRDDPDIRWNAAQELDRREALEDDYDR